MTTDYPSLDKRFLPQAEALAARPYSTLIVKEDDDSMGNPIYMAYCLTLRGCRTQGNTVDEALEMIKDARVTYIWSLLEDGQVVPEPDWHSDGITYLGYELVQSNNQTLYSIIINGNKP